MTPITKFDKSLVEHVKFKVFDLVQDANFLKFDIVFCRNVLIYQQRFAGKPPLFLGLHFFKGFSDTGNKESLDWSETSNGFEIVSETQKIYRLKE